MHYTSEELARISGSRLAVPGRIYIDTKGNRYKGTIDNRIISIDTADKNVSVKLEVDDKIQDLNTYLKNLTGNLKTYFDTIYQKIGNYVLSSRNITINGNIQNLEEDRNFDVTDANLLTSDITTNNVSITKHGFAPKAPNDTSKFLRGDGTWAIPTGGGTSASCEKIIDLKNRLGVLETFNLGDRLDIANANWDFCNRIN